MRKPEKVRAGKPRIRESKVVVFYFFFLTN